MSEREESEAQIMYRTVAARIRQVQDRKHDLLYAETPKTQREIDEWCAKLAATEQALDILSHQAKLLSDFQQQRAVIDRLKGAGRTTG